MNNDAIRAMIAAHPEADDAGIVALFAADRDVWVDVAVAELEGVCRMAGILSRLDDLVVANPQPGFARTAALELLGMIRGKMVRIEMIDPAKRGGILAMLGALVAVEWVAEDERDAILALAQARRTLAEIEGCAGIQAEHVAIARAGG